VASDVRVGRELGATHFAIGPDAQKAGPVGPAFRVVIGESSSDDPRCACP